MRSSEQRVLAQGNSPGRKVGENTGEVFALLYCAKITVYKSDKIPQAYFVILVQYWKNLWNKINALSCNSNTRLAA